MHVAANLPVDCMQANVDPRAPFEEWELDKLANKMRQYCPLLEDMTGATLEQVTVPPDGGADICSAHVRTTKLHHFCTVQAGKGHQL